MPTPLSSSCRLARSAFPLALALAAGLAPRPAAAQESAPEKVRADFPDRRWTPVGAADAGLAGAGLATDPASSAYANPALWLTAPWTFRISGGLMNPNRDDLRSSTVEFDDANGFPLLSEAAFRFQWRGVGLGGYFAQPHYEHGETRFIGFNPANPGGGGDPYARINTFTSATRLAGLGAAMRLQGGVIVGAGAEAVLGKESYRSQPDIPPGSFVADTLDVDRNGTAIGGVVGVAVPIAGTWTVGASYRLAGALDDDDGGSDDAPALGLLGVRYGRTAGSAIHAGLRWLGERTVDLADSSAAPGEARAEARLEYSLGYAYLDPAGTWTLRAGAALSPRPDDAANKLTRFGVSLGVGGEGLRAAVGYTRESEGRAGGRNSSRNLVLATVELGR
jgi:opacity protein-like surface antigen